ncbi:hypothetical protein EDC96DRAFT_501445, partial [Choanephora cucurbitarum]
MELLNAFRYLTLLFSLLGLASHFAQCTLFTVYQKKTDIPGWLLGGHWQYLVIYIAFGLSMTSALMLCVHATCCKRAHVVRGDRTLGTFNSMTSIATLTTITFVYSQEPWTNSIVEFKFPAKGFIPYCSLLDQAHDATYPLLFQRCLLFNCTYILLGILCVLWILLSTIAYTFSPKPKQHSLQQHLGKGVSTNQYPPFACKKQRQIRPIYNYMDFQYADYPMPNYNDTVQNPYLNIPESYCNSTTLTRHHPPSSTDLGYIVHH